MCLLKYFIPIVLIGLNHALFYSNGFQNRETLATAVQTKHGLESITQGINNYPLEKYYQSLLYYQVESDLSIR